MDKIINNQINHLYHHKYQNKVHEEKQNTEDMDKNFSGKTSHVQEENKIKMHGQIRELAHLKKKKSWLRTLDNETKKIM